MREFDVIGTPIAKGRPRFSRRGKYVTTYTPKKTVEYENLVKRYYLEKYKTDELMEGYLKIELKFFMPIVKSTSKKNKQLMIEQKLFPDKKPDLSNLVKSVEDALNGIAFKDDSQIIESHSYKYYSDEPKVTIKISNVIV